jgi:hypothetical protein
MPKRTKVNLHGIDRAFERVDKKLRDLKEEARLYGEEATLDAKIERLGGLRKRVAAVCPESFVVWPLAATTLKVAARKRPRSAGAKRKR